MRFATVLEKTNAVMGKAIIVMSKTTTELMSLKRLAAVIIIGLLPAIQFGAAIWRESFRSGTMSLEMQTQTMVGYFLLFSFVWIVGVYIAYVTIASGMVSVSREGKAVPSCLW